MIVYRVGLERKLSLGLASKYTTTLECMDGVDLEEVCAIASHLHPGWDVVGVWPTEWPPTTEPEVQAIKSAAVWPDQILQTGGMLPAKAILAELNKPNIVEIKCCDCGKETKIKVCLADILDWKAGKPVKKALSYLDRAEQNMIVTGICEACLYSS